MNFADDLLAGCRQQFPALRRTHRDAPVVYLDGPAGTQVPQCVIDAISSYLSCRNANHGGAFITSRESDEMLHQTHQAAADFLGTDDADTVFFGPNMTTLTFALSRALSKTWRAGDEVLVTRLDHDANVTPWVLAARDAGAVVRYVDIHHADCTLNMADLASKMNPRTRLVAVGCASNSVGTINPVADICRRAADVGALSFVDAVHFAPHALIDVNELGCDFLACSAYKFFGPHIGLMWGRRRLLEELTPYKLRPSPADLPGRWMTGTQNHECIAGVLAAIDYLADLGRVDSRQAVLSRRDALVLAFDRIASHERSLVSRMLDGLRDLPSVRVWGISDPDRQNERLPTVSITHAKLGPRELAERLAEQGIFVWHGNYYALQLTEALGLEPEGMVRLGLVHYNTKQEVDRLLGVLRTFEN